ncbi:MAG: homogentisate 1,2-dioxygenase [Deltaproteobacteria bacterium]|nr:MAG: homogentisate 1,2-dioxygenase [Deltaproteobacteria bacterium]
MLDRMQLGSVPRKHHIQLRGPEGELRYEECFTRDGFDGPYTILYHLRRPHTQRQIADLAAQRTAAAMDIDDLVGVTVDDVDRIGLARERDAGDDIGVEVECHPAVDLRSALLCDVEFAQGDYVFVPRGLLHRFLPHGPQQWFWFSLTGGVHVPNQWRNGVGQLRMDAPYCHRDFKRPELVPPRDEGIRALVVRRGGAWHGFSLDHSPLDVVGWDGTVYPWAFPILAFQPRVGSVHLPPTWHGTFAARGALICSFVPRPVDFHPEAIPCPYPHSSTHCDEIIFYCDGNFTSRRGVGPGSISHHPMGVPHGPHPGSYEKSIGVTRTDELAVMADAFAPLRATPAALAIEDAGYQDSFV